LADRVRSERLGRGWSIRTAAAASGQLSNTWWGKFEDGKQPLTDGIRLGVAQAFNWNENWPTELSQLDEMVARMGAQARALRAVLRVVRQLDEWGVDVSGLPGDDELIPPIAQ
jgi:hypothetical protein